MIHLKQVNGACCIGHTWNFPNQQDPVSAAAWGQETDDANDVAFVRSVIGDVSRDVYGMTGNKVLFSEAANNCNNFPNVNVVFNPAVGDENHPAFVELDHDSQTGYLDFATVTAFVGGERWRTAGYRTWARVILTHEFGHVLGMDDRSSYSGGYVMSNPIDEFWSDGVVEFHDDERAAVAARYGGNKDEGVYCDDNPVYFRNISMAAQGSASRLLLSTTANFGCDSVVVKYCSSGKWRPYEEYRRLGAFSVVSGDTAVDYTFVHNVRYPPAGAYLIEGKGPGGVVDGFSVYSPTQGGIGYGYSPEAIAAMRAFNFEHIRSGYWRGVSLGAVSLPLVTGNEAPDCDLLVVAYDDLARDLAPVCDYWQSVGYTVALVSNDGSIDAAELKAYIAEAFQFGNLQTVWLVGAPSKLNSDHPNLVPTGEFVTPVADAFFAELTGDVFFDIGIGRLPARYPWEVVAYVNKELRYHYGASWGGRLPASSYGRVLVAAFPDNQATGDRLCWDGSQERVEESAMESAAVLAAVAPDLEIGLFNSTSLPEWSGGDNVAYAYAVAEAFTDEMALGAHVVVGHSQHNGIYDQFGMIGYDEWASRNVCAPGAECYRPGATIWVNPYCHAATPFLGARALAGLIEPYAASNIPSFELFMSSGLVIFGPAAVSVNSYIDRVSSKMIENMFTADTSSGKRMSLSRAWMQSYNELRREGVFVDTGLDSYAISGDPMIFVRDVYDDSVAAVGEGAHGALGVVISPNPFNGVVRFAVRGVSGVGIDVRVYDVRGRRVWRKRLAADPDGLVNGAWRGETESGRHVGSGPYIVEISDGVSTLREKVMYIK